MNFIAKGFLGYLCYSHPISYVRGPKPKTWVCYGMFLANKNGTFAVPYSYNSFRMTIYKS